MAKQMVEGRANSSPVKPTRTDEHRMIREAVQG